jgi:4,5-dihydroxyphthalate decarboxylase
MADITLTFCATPYDGLLPLINGEIKPDGIMLDYMPSPGGVPTLFYNQMKFQRYDLSEMSMSSFLRMRSIGWPYRLLPVFHNRNFSYTYIHIRKDSGIKQDHPEDLKGKRIGIGDYQQSLGLWTRGILEMEFGIKPEDLIWYQERGEHYSHTGASSEAGLSIPHTIELHYASTDFNTMFLKGELDAVTGLGLRRRKGGSPSRGGVPDLGLTRNRSNSEEPDLLTLFKDPQKEAIRYFKKTGIYPPNHGTIIREGILEEHPWIAASLMDAFEESKRLAIERLNQSPPSLLVFGQHYLQDVEEVFGTDPFPYGITANARALDMAQTFSVRQGLTQKKQPLNEIYPQEIIYREERL